MILRLDVPHLRRSGDAMVVKAGHGAVELTTNLTSDQVADVLNAVADALSTGAYTVDLPSHGGRGRSR